MPRWAAHTTAMTMPVIWRATRLVPMEALEGDTPGDYVAIGPPKGIAMDLTAQVDDIPRSVRACITKACICADRQRIPLS